MRRSDGSDGGSAFPEFLKLGEVARSEGGMSLRDYFAGQAMAALIAGGNADSAMQTLGAAKDAYRVADLLLMAREL